MKNPQKEKLAQAQSLRQRFDSNNDLDGTFEYQGHTLNKRKALAAICEIFERRAKAEQAGGAK